MPCSQFAVSSKVATNEGDMNPLVYNLSLFLIVTASEEHGAVAVCVGGGGAIQ